MGSVSEFDNCNETLIPMDEYDQTYRSKDYSTSRKQVNVCSNRKSNGNIRGVREPSHFLLFSRSK